MLERLFIGPSRAATKLIFATGLDLSLRKREVTFWVLSKTKIRKIVFTFISSSTELENEVKVVSTLAETLRVITGSQIA